MKNLHYPILPVRTIDGKTECQTCTYWITKNDLSCKCKKGWNPFDGESIVLNCTDRKLKKYWKKLYKMRDNFLK